ncbi:MAG TPA: translocase, partial [Eggerthellaceae bacterium]|nr:translocase [Eggerthellaceae bacterium]
MFGIGGFELFIILIFAFLIFGPEKLPEIGRTVGRAIAKFREAQQDMNEALGDEKIIDFNNPNEPFKDPMEALDKLAQHQEDKRKAKQSAAASAKANAAASAGAVGATAATAVAAAKSSSPAAGAPAAATASEGSQAAEATGEAG